MKRFLTTLSLLVIIGILYIGSYGIIVNNFLHTPSDRYYYGAEEGAFDILGDLNAVEHARHGHVLQLHNSSSTIPNTPSPLKQEYLLIGHMSRILSLSSLTTYHATVFLLSILLFAVSWIVIKKLVPIKFYQLLIFSICCLNTGILLFNDTKSIMTRMFYDTLVFQRMTLAKPHYLISNIVIILSIWFLSKAVDNPSKIRYFIFACLCSLVSAYVYAPGAFLTILSIPLFTVLYVLTYRRKRHIPFTQLMAMLFIFSFITVSELWSIKYITGYLSQYIINNTLEHAFTFSVTPLEYIQSIGVVYFLSIISIPIILRSPTTFLLLIIPWVFIHPLGVLVGSDMLQINKLRFYLTPYYFFFGILAGVSVVAIAKWLHKLTRVPTYIICIVLSIPIFGSSIGSYVDSVNKTHVCFCKNQFYDWAYPNRYIVEGIWWLRDHTEPNSIVLSDNYAGALILAFSTNAVYTSEWFKLVGHPTANQRQAEMWQFYNGTMTQEEAYRFLKKWNISYVFYSDQEKLNNENTLQTLPYTFLSEVMNNGKTIVYKVE